MDQRPPAFSGGLRAALPVVEDDGAQAEIQSLREYFRAKENRSDLQLATCRRIRSRVRVIWSVAACLAQSGPRSIKITPRRPRWRGRAKQNGIHTVKILVQ